LPTDVEKLDFESRSYRESDVVTRNLCILLKNTGILCSCGLCMRQNSIIFCCVLCD